MPSDVFMYVVCMYVCVYVCMYVCMCVCIIYFDVLDKRSTAMEKKQERYRQWHFYNDHRNACVCGERGRPQVPRAQLSLFLSLTLSL